MGFCVKFGPNLSAELRGVNPDICVAGEPVREVLEFGVAWILFGIIFWVALDAAGADVQKGDETINNKQPYFGPQRLGGEKALLRRAEPALEVYQSGTVYSFAAEHLLCDVMAG